MSYCLGENNREIREKLTIFYPRFFVITVPPMLSIPNQLEAAYIGQDVTLECHTEAFPTSINYWKTKHGGVIVSGNFSFDTIIFTRTLQSDTRKEDANKSLLERTSLVLMSVKVLS